MNMKPVWNALGAILIFLAIGMLLPLIADLAVQNPDWQAFMIAAALTLYMGSMLRILGTSSPNDFEPRHAFILVALSWTLVPAFGALPFLFGAGHLSLTDAYFEAVSGITTTGSTVMTGLDYAPAGVLLWRAILQWLGGLGIIVLAISILPMLQIGGMHMFRVEAFETFGKALPRIRQLSASIGLIFVAFTLLLTIALYAAGMSGLEAIVHAMTSIATGGYSTSDASVAHFQDPLIESILSLGMFIGGIPFILYVRLISGQPGPLWQDDQVRWYVVILVSSILAVASWLVWHNGFGAAEAFRQSTFNVISIMTGTGYASANYVLWGVFPIMILIALTFLGGCAGSTACGIKVFRIQILVHALKTHVRHLIYPNAIFSTTYNGSTVDRKTIDSVMSFIVAFFMFYAFLSLALALTGLDMTTALSGAATAMSNVGPGFGNIIGPTGTFQSLPDSAKWLLILGMLMGRLELLTFLALLSPMFWRQ